ncbi:MAG: LamG-like jellyroll fold domain-containing protein [Verrucomicrobiota bacterium]
MKTHKNPIQFLTKTFLLTFLLGMVATMNAAVLVNFPFNEGTGTNTADTSPSGLTGLLGAQQDPTTDFVTLDTNSPSGQVGDGSITTSNAGFLVVNDSIGPVLNLTNGPITLEAWVFLPPVGNANVGIVSYGNSYKLGIKSSQLVFTLYGKSLGGGNLDITNLSAGFLLDSQWVHVAAAWEPGVGVHFYVNGAEFFEANTNTLAQSPTHNYLSIAADGFGGVFNGSLDRVRIHNALLTNALPGSLIDSVAATPQPTYASTKVAYNFNEASFPVDSSVSPSRPSIASSVAIPSLSRPTWTNDTPAGLPGDFALAFLDATLPIRQVVTTFGVTNTDLTANNTNYTLEAWIKMPTGRMIFEREVIFRTDGPAPRVSLSINSDRTLHTSLLGNADYTTTAHLPNDGRWHHVAIVMTNFSRVVFYIDGIMRQNLARNASVAWTASTNTPRLLMGKESETRYFRGLIDRVRLSNSAYTNSPLTLDFPAKAGLPLITAQPADVIASVGSNATFSATVTSGTTATYQWSFRTNLADLGGTAIANATNTTLIVSNVSLASQRFYFLTVSNTVGVVESHGARLTARTQPGALTQLWRIAPATAAATNPSNVAIITGASDLERGMAYNPLTDHLLIGARVSSPTAKGIFILNAADGSYVGELNSVASTVVGGTIVMTKVVVADDGAIYVCNFGTLSDSNPLKIYRWADETAEPTLAYVGNPPSGITANQQYGKNMIVRGSGVNTQILMDSRTSILTLFRTANGVDFTPTLMLEDGFDYGFTGMAWGEGDTFWGKQFGEPLYQWTLDSAAQFAPTLRTYINQPGDSFANLSFNTNRSRVAGINYTATPYSVQLWDFANLNSDPILLDTATFSTSATHTLNYGNVLFGNTNRLFALIPNNGITAYSIVAPAPTLGIRRSGNDLIVFWPSTVTGYILESSLTLPFSNPQTVSFSVVGNENQATVQATGNAKFYRLKQ